MENSLVRRLRKDVEYIGDWNCSGKDPVDAGGLNRQDRAFCPACCTHVCFLFSLILRIQGTILSVQESVGVVRTMIFRSGKFRVEHGFRPNFARIESVDRMLR